VILINLLPHREAARKRRKDVFNISLGTSALIGGLLAGVIFLWLQAQISTQQDQNIILRNEIKKLEEQIKEIAGLEEEIAALRARQQAVEDLQSDRNLPVHLLSELARLLPDGMFLRSMKQENQLVILQGSAQSNERISELLRNLGTKSVWLTKPDLVEIVAANIALSPRDQRRVYNFVIRVRLLKSSEIQKASVADAAVDSKTAAADAGAVGSKSEKK
jgi:type IV pilus assembly protein PilN